MLDANGKPIVIKVGGGSDFAPLPPDKYVTQIVKVEAKTEPNPFKGGEIDTKLNFQFVLLDDKKEDEKGNSLRGRYLWKRTSLSLNEKSWLFKLLKGVLGRQPTDAEMNSFDPESLVGKRVDCMVEQQPSKDGSKIYSNVISFSKASAKGCMGNELKDFDYQAAVQKSLEKKSQGVQPATKEDVDDFIKGLEADQK